MKWVFIIQFSGKPYSLVIQPIIFPALCPNFIHLLGSCIKRLLMHLKCSLDSNWIIFIITIIGHIHALHIQTSLDISKKQKFNWVNSPTKINTFLGYLSLECQYFILCNPPPPAKKDNFNITQRKKKSQWIYLIKYLLNINFFYFPPLPFVLFLLPFLFI